LPNPGGGAEYGDMIAELRHFLDVVAAAAPDPATSAGLAADLAAWSGKLAPLAVEERRAVFARRLDLPGRGQTMSPAFVVEGGDRDSVHGTTTADYLHTVFEPTAKAIKGLEQALAALGILDEALTLDLRRPQDYFHRTWSTAFRARDLAALQAPDDATGQP
jgi:hypothetical protein